jgi:hypothetical protein
MISEEEYMDVMLNPDAREVDWGLVNTIDDIKVILRDMGFMVEYTLASDKLKRLLKEPMPLQDDE